MKNTKRIIAIIVTSTLFLSINNVADAAKKAKAPAIGPTGNYIYRYSYGEQQRLDASKKWQKKDSRKANKFDPIRVAAYKSITSLPADPNHANIEFEDQFRSTFPKDLAELIRFQSVESAKRISPQFDIKVKVKLIGVTEKDQDFVKNELPKIVNENGYGGPMLIDVLRNYETKNNFYASMGTGGGSAGYEDDKGYAYYLAHTSTFATTETFWPVVAPHEMAHILQGVLSRDNGNMGGEGEPQSKINGHLIEGSANTVGMALGLANLGWYSDEMDKLLARDISFFRGRVTVRSKAEAIKVIKLVESRSDETSSQLSYSVGQIVWEYFIGTYGMAKYVEFLKNMKSTENFNANLVKTIGKDREAFYSDAADYLYKTWQRLI